MHYTLFSLHLAMADTEQVGLVKFHFHMHAGSLAPFEVDLKLWPNEQCFEAAVSVHAEVSSVELTIATNCGHTLNTAGMAIAKYTYSLWLKMAFNDILVVEVHARALIE